MSPGLNYILHHDCLNSMAVVAYLYNVKTIWLWMFKNPLYCIMESTNLFNSLFLSLRIFGWLYIWFKFMIIFFLVPVAPSPLAPARKHFNLRHYQLHFSWEQSWELKKESRYDYASSFLIIQLSFNLFS